ncbi:hypothetical protein [Bacillus pumilus]|nr:hypothetical protein [Bacillus pumilus]
MNKRIKDPLLILSIETQLVAKEQNVDLESFYFQKETKIDSVLQYNALQV